MRPPQGELELPVQNLALREDVAVAPAPREVAPSVERLRGALRAGVIVNAKSHRNRGDAARTNAADGVFMAYPREVGDLDAILAEFAGRGVELLVIDGGDGTVRDVLTRASRHFPDGLPRLAVLPSGKTNALALDLGAPRHWTLDAALAAAEAGQVRQRAPLEIWRAGATAPEMRGFLFGAGAFVRATRAAQRAHGLGLVDALAVGVTLVAAVLRTLFGGPRSGWRAGDSLDLTLDGQRAPAGRRFLLLASTLKRLPLGLRPFGTPRAGAKVLDVDAAPKRLLRALPVLLSGRDAPWLTEGGYRRADVEAMKLSLDGAFVLDGEVYPGGDLIVRMGEPLEFVAP